jgi:hypothetical protein
VLWVATAPEQSDARWVCALFDVGADAEAVSLPDLHTAQRWYVVDGAVDVATPTLSQRAGAETLVALSADVVARISVPAGGRARVLGLWPRLDPAAESALLEQLGEPRA